jgi:predicted nucleic-acid-binding Zn-ribbon protein
LEGEQAMVNKYECNHCGLKMAQKHIFCPSCGDSHVEEIVPRQYMKWNCEECGHELEIWLDQLEEQIPASFDRFKYERRHLMWHCTECGCDYENYWETQFGDTSESQIQRKYWG